MSSAPSQSSYDVELDAAWTANGHCTAGYLATVAARAALEDERAPLPAVTTVHARYLHTTAPGPATVTVEPVRTGTGGADWRVLLHSGDRLCVVATVGTGQAPEPGPSATPPDVPAQEDCLRLPSRAPGFDLPVMDVLLQYADPAGMGWLGGEPSGRGLAQGWLEPAGGADSDTLTLVAAADSLPTATFDRGLQGWAATVDLAAHVMGAPRPGPLRVRRQVHATAGDLVSLTWDAWDSQSSLMATGLQLCRLRG